MSRDGADPAELRWIARSELGARPSVQVLGTRKDNAADVVARLRTIGLQVVRNTRDGARTAEAIAARAGMSAIPA